MKRRAFLFGWPAVVVALLWLAAAIDGGLALATLAALELGVAIGEGTHPPPRRASGELVDLTGRRPK